MFWGHPAPTLTYTSMCVMCVHFMCYLFVFFVSSFFRFLAFLAFRNFQVLKEPHLYKKEFLEHYCQPWLEAGVYKIFTEPVLMRFPALIKRVWLLNWNDLPKLSWVHPWLHWILKILNNRLKQEHKLSSKRQSGCSNPLY